MPKHSLGFNIWQDVSDSLFAVDVWHTFKALMTMGCRSTFGHTVVSAVSETTFLKAVQTNLITVLSSAASLKVDFRDLNVDRMLEE